MTFEYSDMVFENYDVTLYIDEMTHWGHNIAL